MKKIVITALISCVLMVLTMSAMAEAPVIIEKYWERLCGVDPSGDNVRTMAVWEEGDLLATINRYAGEDAIKLYNATTGLPNITVEHLAMSGVSCSIPSGLYNLVDGDWSEDGVFFACSLSYTSGKVLRVYCWDNITTGPREIYNSGADWLGYRMGDALDVIGNVSDNTVKVMISGNTDGSYPLVLTTSDNGVTYNATSLSNPVRAQDIDQVSDGTFWAVYTSSLTNVTHYAADGSVIDSIPGTGGVSAIAVDEDNNLIYTMGVNKSGSGLSSKLQVWDIATKTKILECDDPIDVGVGDIGSGYANGSASVEIADSAGGNGRYIYALSERNGCARYSRSTMITVDGVGAEYPNYATVQSAIDSYCVGAENDTTTLSKPLVIAIDPSAGPYDESLDLNDATIGHGNIVGDIRIRSSVPGEKVVLKLQKGISASDDGLLIYQSSNNVSFKDIVFCESTTGTRLTDEIIKIDENGANSDLCWVEFYDCILTDIDTSGNPMITSRAEALNPPPASGTGRVGTSYPYFIQWYGDANESTSLLLDGVVFYHNPLGYYALRLQHAGIAGEAVYMNNCLISYTENYAIRYGDSGGGDGLFRVTGDDAGAGPDHCTTFYKNAGHAVWFYGGTGIAKFDNILVYTDAPSTARGISGSSGWDLQVSDSIFNTPGPNIVDGLANYPEYPPFYKRCTFHTNAASNALYSVSSSVPLTVEDCIFSGAGTKFAGTLTAGVVCSNCAFVTDGPDAITDIGDVTTATAIINAAPMYKSYDATTADFMDVQNVVYAGAGTGGSDLAGGADYVGGFYGVYYITFDSAVTTDSLAYVPALADLLSGADVNTTAPVSWVTNFNPPGIETPAEVGPQGGNALKTDPPTEGHEGYHVYGGASFGPDFTVEVLFWTDQLEPPGCEYGLQQIIGADGYTGNMQWALRIWPNGGTGIGGYGQLQLMTNAGAGEHNVDTPSGISTQAWHLACVVYDDAADQMTLYLDNQLIGSCNPGFPGNSWNMFSIAGWANPAGSSRSLDGYIDAVYIGNEKRGINNWYLPWEWTSVENWLLY